MSGREIALSNTYHVTIGENSTIELKTSSPWYTQVQTNLGVSGFAWCDFVMFTQKSPHLTVQRRYFDKAFFDYNAEIAMEFYNKFVLPSLHISKVTLEASNS